MPIHISPHFTEDKLRAPSVDDLIDVFEDRMKYWLFEPAKSLLNDAYGQIAGFCLLLTYFEGIYSYVQGKTSKGQSTAFFKKAFLEVVRTSGLNETLLTRIAEILYKDARCGFFHDGMFRERICLKSLKKGELLVTLPKKNGHIDENGEIQSILVDPVRFGMAVERHFAKFITTLRNPIETERRAKFKSICRLKWDWEKGGRVIGISDPTEA